MNSCVPLKDQKERQNPSIEVINAEKQLWALIHSKGLLHTEVQDLYRKVRFGYEKIILNDHEEVELQDIEYSLWKLHYKHIDEFRKRIKQTSANAENTKSATPQNVANAKSSIDCHIEQFKLFLSEATEFYQDLITKLGRCYGLPEDPLAYEKGGTSCAIDPTNLRNCQYTCHRFLVCLGDLSRYRELFWKLDSQRHNWSVVATYYFKATMVWPDSGNPQNQLALLATYIGDDFLALYHCIRSLAIKEPFPDAWGNLILLFEKNRSSQLHSLLREADFNFLSPSERSTPVTKLQSSIGSLSNDTPQTTEHISPAKSDLWPLFVRMISFFFVGSSLEEFPCTFASTIREMDSLLALDDTKLKATLESYQHMDSARTGPYRTLQMVSILIFIIESQNECLEHESKEKNNVLQPILMQLALTATFVCLGRLVERCSQSVPLEVSPLLPTVLVFVEWLVGTVDKIETYSAFEKVRSAMSYFGDAFVDLLNQLDKNEGVFKHQGHTALWEDYEMRGFAPVAPAHGSLDFSTHPQLMDNFDSSNLCRAHRIFHAAIKIVDGSNGSQKWIFYNNLERKFYTEKSRKFPDQRKVEVAKSTSEPEEKELQQQTEAKAADSSSDLEVQEPQQHKGGPTKENEKDVVGEIESHPFENGKSVAAIEEEEVILFKPIMRYNSAPLHTSIIDDEISVEGIKDQAAPSDDTLRRATSLFVAQNQNQIDPLHFRSDANNFRTNKPFKQLEAPLKDHTTTTYPAGPPSLSAWVLNTESSNIEKDKGTRHFYKPGLSPIDEIASASLTSLSFSETKDSVIESQNVSRTTPYFPPPPPPPPPYSAPLPSAPLLPDDAIWFSANSSGFSEAKSSRNIKETDGILGATPMSSYTNWPATHGLFPLGPSIPGFKDGYQPVVGMSSSEWLHQYKNQNLDRASSQLVRPVHLYAPKTIGNFYGQDTTRFDICDQWGNPLSYNQMVYLESPQLHAGFPPPAYGADEQRMEKHFYNYQRASPYGCGGVVTDLRAEQPPLLQFLKEKEWQLQRQSQVRGPTYMGN